MRAYFGPDAADPRFISSSVSRARRSLSLPERRSPRPGGNCGLFLFAFLLLFFLDAILTICPNALSLRPYFASVQKRRQNISYKAAVGFTTRISGSPERPPSRLKPSRLESSSILWFSRSTWPTTRLTPRALA